ncbi:MAG: phosphate ABC transporter substrate-binding protein PstS, partial [Alistipes sp.]|nr:phosphate ABC transporter substrate-binding protein PstS [Alistipes sp.]
MKKIFKSVVTMVAAFTMVSCGGNATNGVREAQELSGAGATFPLPFYNVVFENFSQVNGDVV